MSATTSTITLQSIFASFEALLKAQLSAAVQVEAKTDLPAFVTFLNWVSANPGSAINPVTVLPQLALLQAAVLAAQSTADSADVASVASALSSSLTSFINAA